jgi:hypothetical protein
MNKYLRIVLDIYMARRTLNCPIQGADENIDTIIQKPLTVSPGIKHSTDEGVFIVVCR